MLLVAVGDVRVEHGRRLADVVVDRDQDEIAGRDRHPRTTSVSIAGVGTTSTGMSSGAPNATDAFENAIAVAIVAVSSTISASENSSSSAVRSAPSTRASA